MGCGYSEMEDEGRGRGSRAVGCGEQPGAKKEQPCESNPESSTSWCGSALFWLHHPTCMHL